MSARIDGDLGFDGSAEPADHEDGDFEASSEALQAAIRRFTVDASGGEPNGPAERAMVDLRDALDPERHPRGLGIRELRAANGIAARLLGALAQDTRALRIAADSFFGGDFRKPEAP